MHWTAECLLLPPLYPLLLLIPALYPCLHHLYVSVSKVHQVLDLNNLSIFPKFVEVIVPVKLVPPIEQLLLKICLLPVIARVSLMSLSVLPHELALRILLSDLIIELLELRGLEGFF